MTKTYNIILNPGCDETELYSLVSSVVDQVAHRDTFFIASCTKEEVDALENHPSVKFCVCHDDVPVEEDATISKNLTYHRTYSNSKSGTNMTHGNWGLKRHTASINTATTMNADVNFTYQNDYTGDGVDIILNLASIIDRNDPEFQTSGTTRLQTFQWNTLSGFSSLPTVDYTSSTVTDDVSAHAEAVAAICAGNTYGWATDAALYIWPRDQMNAAEKYLSPWGWDAFKAFHENKGNSRPTLVVDAIQYITTGNSTGSVVLFRDEIYSEVAPGGTRDYTVKGSFFGDVEASSAFGNTFYPKNVGEVNIYSNGGNSMDIRNLSTTDKNTIKSLIADKTNYSLYATHVEPVEEMIAAGVHHVSAAGNYRTKLSLPGNPDYDNGNIRVFTAPTNNAANEVDHFRVGYYYPLCREDVHHASDTIVVAAISSEVGVDPDYGTNERLAHFSNRGDRVDTAAAGENIWMDLYSNGDYMASGTSFASPNVGGMAACILEKYPTTTPAQLRKYFRQVAKSSTTLYDGGTTPVASSKYGDSPYFDDPVGLKGYSGNIAYLSPSIVYNPTTFSYTNITSTETTTSSNKLNFTISQINTKLASV